MSTIVRSGLAALSGVLACIAIALTLNDPELTYSSDITEEAREIQVRCVDDVSDGSSERTGAIADAPLLDAGEFVRGRYEVTRGEDSLDRVTEDASERKADPDQVYRGINADCAAARSDRTNVAVRVLGGAIVVALLALLTPVLLRRE
ncbi:hypothetical protein [Solicola gregarius]|uniref:Uncharacterized protein n=1 Tax=Solicola gregarius TaxID=2908642 RepID=A0AA46YM37_9ACTN|nr:hypothetical protein [Solicola gregarius]UYM06146.1 hypothetical protein L0C25_03475 [Solicola gregarius]